MPRDREPGRKGRYFNTLGGNPVSAAVALAVLEVIERERLMQNAAAVGAYLRHGLEALAGRHELLGQVRGTGLFIGLDIERNGRPATEETARVVNGLRECRVLISASGPHANTLKIRPPLPFSRDNAGMFLGALNQVLVAL